VAGQASDNSNLSVLNAVIEALASSDEPQQLAASALDALLVRLPAAR